MSKGYVITDYSPKLKHAMRDCTCSNCGGIIHHREKYYSWGHGRFVQHYECGHDLYEALKQIDIYQEEMAI